MEGWLVQVDQRGTHCMDGAIHCDPQATARWALSSQHHPHSVDAKGSALVCGLEVQPSLTLPWLIIQLLQWMAAWALSLLRVEAFVLTRAVRRCAGSVSGPNKSLLQRMPLWLTGFHLRTYLFRQLCLQSLRNSLCLFSKQAFKYTLLYFLFHKKTRAEQTCVNKPVGAPLAVGSQQQQGHHFQISSQLCSKQQGAKQQTQCGKSHWWGLLYEKMLSLCPVDIGHGEAGQRPVCELSPTLS